MYSFRLPDTSSQVKAASFLSPLSGSPPRGTLPAAQGLRRVLRRVLRGPTLQPSHALPHPSPRCLPRMHHARTACVQKGHLPVKFSPCHDFRIFVFVWLRRQRKRLFPHIRQRLQIRGKKRSERLCAAREGGRAGAEPARGAGPALLGSEPRPPCVAGLSPAPDPVISGRDKAGPRHRAPAVPGSGSVGTASRARLPGTRQRRLLQTVCNNLRASATEGQLWVGRAETGRGRGAPECCVRALGWAGLSAPRACAQAATLHSRHSSGLI